MTVDAALTQVMRNDFGRVLATLVRITGEFELAEDCVQDALIAAHQSWAERGIPDDPRAWVIRSARNRAIDIIRRRQRFREKARVIGELQELAPHPSSPEARMVELPDDRLRLLFTCCHPALRMDARVALTLRTVAGLTTDEIARAFFVERPTMAQRLVRAKRKITLAGIPYGVPDRSAVDERLSGVLAVLYLVFNEGYSPTEGEQTTRVDLAEEAIRLARIVVGLRPDHRECAGLLALMLMHHARRDARQVDGELVLLEHQDRGRWDRACIDEARPLVEAALRGGAGPYALQAAIAALHTTSASWEETDWPQIEALYRVLLTHQPSAVVALNHAVAVAMVHGPAAGLELLSGLETALSGHHLFHASRGELLRRCGRIEPARTAFVAALERVGTEPERRFLERALGRLDA
ncbi:MAG: RNA polymerase sigma factor [Proteobacteria bacterium]|nr:RNA polymerase sigma factor [Pseudomonadota bacterium]